MIAPPWLVTALHEVGVAELPGPEHNPRILEYHAATDLHAGAALTDEAAYCGSFLAWVMRRNGFEPPEKAFRARNWQSFGRAVDPCLGAIATVRRRRKGSDRWTGSWGGWHVGFYLNETRGGFAMLSANVSDRVGVDFFSRRLWDLKATRMPVRNIA